MQKQASRRPWRQRRGTAIVAAGAFVVAGTRATDAPAAPGGSKDAEEDKAEDGEDWTERIIGCCCGVSTSRSAIAAASPS